jgi:hypothetical protein
MTNLHDAASKALLVMQKTVEYLDEDCLDPRCDECKPWRPIREAINELSEALANKQAEPVAWVTEPGVESMLRAGRFCDANCTAMDHHPDCQIGNPSF